MCVISLKIPTIYSGYMHTNKNNDIYIYIYIYIVTFMIIYCIYNLF